MATVALKQETYLPDDEGDVGRVYDFLAARERAGMDQPEPRCLLAGPDPDDHVELPAHVYQVLRQVVEAMRENLAVTVVPQTQTLTTQQAADLLGVSRPTVIKLLDEGKIPFDRAGTHRRILLHELLTYRAQRREEQYQALAAMAADPLDEDDPVAVMDTLKAAREAAAAARQKRSAEKSSV
ncbi:hypothetical protein GCM10022204_26660 [Microlunatus aurantiacus]|uniref:Helix-turn-helix domain-containing protein n=1 Tax=Microlunatus aurantiacus TaxID=446786 RepID=A0ABP7DP10_9ACTN